jgi:cytochrome c biogenesis protein CcdA
MSIIVLSALSLAALVLGIVFLASGSMIGAIPMVFAGAGLGSATRIFRRSRRTSRAAETVPDVGNTL